MSERWLPVKGYEGLYEVSDRGRVRVLSRGRILKQHPNDPRDAELLDLRTRLAAAEAVVERLPVTKDGKRVTTDDSVWFCRDGEIYEGRVVLPSAKGWMKIGPRIADEFDEFDTDDEEAPDIYSTRAALAAREQEGKPTP